jgi:hypothetical protein
MVRTPLWSVRLPRDGNAAFAITTAMALFGSLWIVVRGTSGHPWLTFGLVLPIDLLFFYLIFSQRPVRNARHGKAPRRGHRPFRSDDRSSRIEASGH